MFGVKSGMLSERVRFRHALQIVKEKSFCTSGEMC